MIMKKGYLSEFSERLRESGYGHKMRMVIIKRGVEIYDNQVKKDIDGTCPLYRPKGYEEETRRKKKRRSKASWYKTFDSVLFCPPTPNGELARRWRQVIQRQKADGINIKVVEKAGVRIGTLLPGLQAKEDCERKNCMIHMTGGRGRCNRENIVYQGHCLACRDIGKKSIYIGESSRSGYVRGKQHIEAIREPVKHQTNAFARHIMDKHNGNETRFEMSIVKYNRTPLERQVREGVEIVRTKADYMLNSKLDHFQPGIRQVTFGDDYDDFGY